MRYIGIDYGTKRVGWATADEETGIAVPRGVIGRTNDVQLLTEIAALIGGEHADLLVVGLPLGHDGGETEMSALVRAFAEKAKEKLGVPVVVENELLTSSIAAQSSTGDEHIDAASAALILQSYLDKRRSGAGQ